MRFWKTAVATIAAAALLAGPAHANPANPYVDLDGNGLGPDGCADANSDGFCDLDPSGSNLHTIEGAWYAGGLAGGASHYWWAETASGTKVLEVTAQLPQCHLLGLQLTEWDDRGRMLGQTSLDISGDCHERIYLDPATRHAEVYATNLAPTGMGLFFQMHIAPEIAVNVPHYPGDLSDAGSDLFRYRAGGPAAQFTVSGMPGATIDIVAPDGTLKATGVGSVFHPGLQILQDEIRVHRNLSGGNPYVLSVQAFEVCNGQDDDLDGAVDEGACGRR